MTDLRCCTRSFLTEFIQLYKTHQCLWNVELKTYNNRFKRDEAYEFLIQKLREIEPNVDKTGVVRKINSLRTVFRKEYVKVEKSKKSGVPPDEVYKPRLWYYDMLLFTVECKSWNPNDESSNDILKSANEYKEEEEHFEEYKEDNSESQDSFQEVENKSCTYEPPLKISKVESCSYENDVSPKNSHSNLVPSDGSETSDACELFGKSVAFKLKTMNKLQRIFAEKLINDILFYGELNELSLTSTRKFNQVMEKIDYSDTSKKSTAMDTSGSDNVNTFLNL